MSNRQRAPRTFLKEVLAVSLGGVLWLHGACAAHAVDLGNESKPNANERYAQAVQDPAAKSRPAASDTPASGATPPSPPQAETPAVVMDGQQIGSILGRKVRGTAGDEIGRIVDILVDKSGQVRAAIIDFGGFLGVGTRQIAVDWKIVQFPADGNKDAVVVDLTRDQLRVTPAYKAGEQIVIIGQPGSNGPGQATTRSSAEPAADPVAKTPSAK